MTLSLGILADSYRRQLRRPLDRPPIEIVLDKVAPLAAEFAIRPLGIDFGASQLPRRDPGYLDELKERLAALGLMPTVIVGTLMLHADRDVSEPALANAIDNLAVAKRLGSPLGLYYFGYGGRVTRDGRLRLAADQVRRLADAAASYGLRVTTENYDYFTSDDLLALFAAVGRENVGLHNDTGNWLILGEDPLEATRKLASYTYHAHVRDYALRDGVFASVPIGQGIVDVPSVLAELATIGATRDRFVLTVEMDLDDGDEDQAVRECVRFMVRWLETSRTPGSDGAAAAAARSPLVVGPRITS